MSAKQASPKQTILITGGTGFAGSHLVEALIAQGFRDIHVTCLNASGGYLNTILPDQNFHAVNLIDQQQTQAIIEKIKPTQIYHLAALAAVGSSFQQTKQTLDNNIQLQLSVLESAKSISPMPTVLNIGSGLQYLASAQPLPETALVGPLSPYGISKSVQEMLAFYYFKSFKLPVVFARPFNHIGERQAPGFVVSDFAQQIAKIEKGQQKPEILVGNLNASRDFTDVKDMVNAYILLMNKGKLGEIYNIGTAKAYKIADLLQLMIDNSKQFTGKSIVVQPDSKKIRPLDVEVVIANNGRIQHLGWKPKWQLTATIDRILNYWRNLKN